MPASATDWSQACLAIAGLGFLFSDITDRETRGIYNQTLGKKNFLYKACCV